MHRRKLTLSTLVLVALFATLVTAALAAAAETTRAEYVAAVEPICQSNSRANERILRGVKADVRRGRLRLAAAALSRASHALERAYSQLRSVSQPPADSATLAKWLAYVHSEAVLFKRTAAALHADRKAKASHYEVQLIHQANLANNTVLEFDFHYCRFEPSKFT